MQPHTGKSPTGANNLPLWTFDENGNLFLAHSVMAGASPVTPNGPLTGGVDLGSMPQAGDEGLIVQTFDRFLCSQSATLVTGGSLYLAGMYLRTARTISSIWFGIGTAAVTPTATQNWALLVSGAGTVLGSAGIDSLTTSVGVHPASITPVTAGPGLVWAGLFFNAATEPALIRGLSTAGSFNIGLPAQSRFGIGGTSLTAPPASIIPANITGSGAQSIWAGLS